MSSSATNSKTRGNWRENIDFSLEFGGKSSISSVKNQAWPINIIRLCTIDDALKQGQERPNTEAANTINDVKIAALIISTLERMDNMQQIPDAVMLYKKVSI